MISLSRPPFGGLFFYFVLNLFHAYFVLVGIFLVSYNLYGLKRYTCQLVMVLCRKNFWFLIKNTFNNPYKCVKITIIGRIL